MPDLPPRLLEMLNKLDELSGRAWTVSPLAGGITNQNYLIRVEEKENAAAESYVLRIAGAGTEQLGINRNCEYAAAKLAAECGVGMEAIEQWNELGALLCRYAPGRTLATGDLEGPELMARVVRAIRRFHDCESDVGWDRAALETPPREWPGLFCVFTTVELYLQLAHENGVPMPGEVRSLADSLKVIDAQSDWGADLRPCHNDLLPANLIDDGERVRIIDWEYAAVGDPWFDLGNLAENNRLSESAERMLLELYFGELRTEDVVRLRTMRFASAMREAAWGFAQVALSKLAFDFDEYARSHLERARQLTR